MKLRRLLAILNRDIRDAGRDGRIVVLLLLPIGMAIFYNATIDDDGRLPTTDVAVVASDGQAVSRELRAVVKDSAEIEITQVRDREAARRQVAEGDVDVAVVVAAGSTPSADVLVAADADPTAQAVAALVPDALTRAAGQEPAARTQITPVAATDQKPYEVLETKTFALLLIIITLIAFIALMVVPIQTAEELETETFSALRLAMSGGEVLTAKALAGVVFSAAGVALTVGITKLTIDRPLLFFGAAIALSISLVGFGLLLGLLVPNSNAINSYGAFLLFPFLGLAAAVFIVDSGTFSTILDLLPFPQAAKLLSDGLSTESPFDAGAASWLVIGVWAVLGFALLRRIAVRREL